MSSYLVVNYFGSGVIGFNDIVARGEGSGVGIWSSSKILEITVSISAPRGRK